MRSTTQPLHLFCLVRDGGWGWREKKNKARFWDTVLSSIDSLASTQYCHTVVSQRFFLEVQKNWKKLEFHCTNKSLGQFVTFLTIPPFMGKQYFYPGLLSRHCWKKLLKAVIPTDPRISLRSHERAHFRNLNNTDFPMRSQIQDLHSQIGLQEHRHSFSLLNYPSGPSNEGCVQPVLKTEPWYTMKPFLSLFGVGRSSEKTRRPFSLLSKATSFSHSVRTPESTTVQVNPQITLFLNLMLYRRFCSSCNRRLFSC